MARDGNGDFTRVAGPYVGGTTILKDNINDEMDDVADALSDSINKAGTKAFAAAQSMGGFALTDLPTPSTSHHAARKAYVDSAISGLSATYQPLDATLTALAALSWSSGNALVQFTAADTVSLTLTPSVTSLTLSGVLTLADGTSSAPVVTNTGDTNTGLYFPADDQVGLVGGGAGGGIFKVYSGGAFMEAGVLLAQNGGVSGPGFAFLNEQDCGWYVIGTNNWAGSVGGSKFVDIGTALIDFTVAVRSRLAVSSETTGTMGTDSANKVVACTGNITLDDDIFTARDTIVFDPGTSNRTFTRSAGLAMYVNGTDVASATLAANQLGTVHWRDTDTAILSGAFT